MSSEICQTSCNLLCFFTGCLKTGEIEELWFLKNKSDKLQLVCRIYDEGIFKKLVEMLE